MQGEGQGEGAEQLVIRSYRPGDETRILELFARSFHQPRSLEHWRWKFQQNPAGGHRISLAFLGERLVAQYAGYPLRVFVDGSVVEANQIGDTMTDPAVRHLGRGPSSVLGRTARHFYETHCAGKVVFNFGFNVANIQKFSIRFLGSDRVESVPYRLRDLRARPLPPLHRIERWLRGCRLELTTATSPEWDELFRRVAPRYGFLLVRDAAYVRWRYLECPDISYAVVAIRKWGRLVGWLVFRNRDRRLSVGDFLIDPECGDYFVLALRHLASLYDVDAIDGWFPARPPWLGEILAASGLESRPEPQDLALMCVPFTQPDAVQRMRESLYYGMGDGDLF